MTAVEPAAPAHAERLIDLFRADATACFCRWWHFSGDKNAWLERCASAPGVNEHELRDALASGSDEARGLVAIEPGGALVGWVKVTPAVSLPKLYDQRLYRGLPVLGGDRRGVFAIGCMLVHPDRRRRGVATALVAGAVRVAPSWSATALEAFPHRATAAAHDGELWRGPVSSFLANGFVVVHDFAPYPVLRRTL